MKIWKRVCGAGVATLGMLTVAHAADLIVYEPEVAGSSVQNWDGAFIGIFGGYGFGSMTDPQGFFPPFYFNGALLGGTAGANFYLTDGIVAGVVGDIAWSNMYRLDGGFSFGANWLGSVRGRLGFDAGAIMPYLTAGLAFGQGKATLGALSPTGLHVGWTAGAGVEVAVTESISVDLLYRYSDLGEYAYAFAPSYKEAFTTNTFQVGVNFRF